MVPTPIPTTREDTPVSKTRKSFWKRLDWRLRRQPKKRPKVTKRYLTSEENPDLTRAQRREKKSLRFRLFRGIRVHKDTGEKELQYWEWRPTSIPPMKKKTKQRRRNEIAKASRRKNR